MGDLENIRGNIEFIRLASETMDMMMEGGNQRFLHNQMNEGDIGGTWFERALQERIPGYFKMVGLTPWTVFWKDMTMFAAQHTVMADAIKIASGANDVAAETSRLAALGMNTRDMKLLGRMEVEINDGGKLILPNIDKWAGSDGIKAKQLLLDAIHAEARRAIVTPSIGDKSLMFYGVWEKDGNVLAESDLMTLPMQFLSYGVGAHNKLLTSALQGRDKHVVGGIFMMIMGGILSNYLKTPENAWRNKSYMERVVDGYEAAGIGGFWFGDINHTLEQMSNNSFGIRPALGLDPKFGSANKSVADYSDAAGPGLATAFDLSRAFWDSDLTSTQRAHIIRRAVPYNNVLWWSGIARNMAQDTGELFE